MSSVDSISNLHYDIIQTQILTRLNGPTLAATASTSSHFKTLCTKQKLWQEISTDTWPSIKDPRVVKAISSFPSGYVSFFADSYPLAESTWQTEKDYDLVTTGLISAVDLYYRDELVFSKVQEMGMESDESGSWFLTSPFRVEMLDPNETIKAEIRYPGGHYEVWERDIEKSLRLNWIVIDPIKKRAANVSSRKAVLAGRNWLTGDLDIRFSTVVTHTAEAGPPLGGSSGHWAEVAAVVSCGSAEVWKEVDEEVGEVQVRNVSLQAEDIEGKCLKGRDSLVILQMLLGGKRFKDSGEEMRAKERYADYVEVKKQWREYKERREKAQDMIFMVFGYSLFMFLWSFILLR